MRRSFLIGLFLGLSLLPIPADAKTESKTSKQVEEGPDGGEAGFLFLPPRVPKVPAVPDVNAVRRDLQAIVAINQSLRTQQYAQIAEIQKITEQARAHQKLLQSLGPKMNPVKPPAAIDIDEILRLEKIRLIQEQARRNREELEKIQEKSENSEKPEKPSKKKSKH